MAGETYVQQLERIADGITGADKAIDSAKTAFVTVIKIGVAVATEEDPISPLVEGIAQVGTDVVKEMIIGKEIRQTLTQLEAAWAELDEVTLELARRDGLRQVTEWAARMVRLVFPQPVNQVVAAS